MVDFHAAGLPSGVTLTEGNGGLPVLRVQTPVATGEVYLQGATVTSWTPTGAPPVLWTSARSRYERGVAIRGGIPVCAPWFGPGRHNDKEPAHGWFRVADWILAEATTAGDEVTLRFTLDGANAPVPDGEPSDVRGEYTVTFGSALTTSLTVTAGADGLDLEAALHAYLGVSDVREVIVEGLAGTRYVDKAPGGRAVNAQSGDLTFTRETDRVYAHDGSAAVVDPGLGRRVMLTKEGSASTVVWNPWTEKAASMPDFGDDEWTSMMCLETANALAGHVTLGGGESHTMTATLSLEDA